MKRTLHKLMAITLVIAALITLAAATALGSYTRQDGIELSETAQLTHAQISNTAVTGSKQTENIIEYYPDSTVKPVVAFGTTLYGRSNLDYVANYLKTTGKTVIAGINGGFFDMSTGIPLGYLVTNGTLRSGDNKDAVGFRDDGTAIIGRPGFEMNVTFPNGGTSTTYYNKTISAANGLVLYSRDFDSKTKNTISAYNVVLAPSKGTLQVGETITAEVVAIVADTKSCDIPAGGMVLSMATDTMYPTSFAARLGTLKVGDSVSISTKVDEAWKNVTNAVSGVEMLVVDGAAKESFTLDSAKNRTARTAIGIKKDGTVVMYTMDGLQSGYSAGLTLKELAARMVELGCVSALNLDGGGSTTLSVQYPGDAKLSSVNQPSGGTQRQCANFIFLAADTQTSGMAEHLHIYPYDKAVLAGSSLQLTVKATDGNYLAAAVPSDLSYSAAGGTVDESGIFTAGESAGSANVRVVSEYAEGSRNIRVVKDPTGIVIKNQESGAQLTSLSVAGGRSVDLTAVATSGDYTLVSQDKSFRWNVESGLGTIDQNGKFTAAELTKSATGTITCTAGTKTVSLALTVTPLAPEGSAIFGFEPTDSVASGTGLTVSRNENLAYVRYGTGSLKASYQLTSAETAEGKRQVHASFAATLPEGTDTVGLWIYGDNSNNSLSLRFGADGETVSKWLTQLNFDGWKYVTAEIPAGATEVIGITITEYDTATALAGTIYLDQLIGAKGALNDITAPVITAAQSGTSVTVSATDAQSGIHSVRATIDGASVEISGGVLALPQDGKAHQVQITAQDKVGNLSSKTMTISGTIESPFADTSTHWAKQYIDYCYREGIMKGSADAQGTLKFRPNDSMTRQEFVVALISFLDINTADYALVSMPFADNGKIAVWAQESMRAAYALGLLTGSPIDGALYANPTATITRQEAMAILGRTQTKGYPEDSLSGFTDAAKISGWARSDIASMVSRGVISGSGGKLSPGGTVTRGQVATMLYSLY